MRRVDDDRARSMPRDDQYAACLTLDPGLGRSTVVERISLDDEHTLRRYEPEWSDLIDLDEFAAVGYDGEGEYAAVLDTGVDRSTPALRDNWALGLTTIPGDDGLFRRGGSTDSFFHGTATAGCLVQTMPRTRLVSLKCFDQRPGRLNDAQWWVEAIDRLHRWQRRERQRGLVVNVSLAITPDKAPRGSTAWERAWRDVRDLRDVVRQSVERFGNVYCAAASNEGLAGSPAAYPAAFDELVFAVGSIRVHRRDGGFRVDLSEFSNVNPYVDFVCLGEDFWTFLPPRNVRLFRQTYARAIAAGWIRVAEVAYRGQRQWLAEFDGTSFAAPAFAGMVVGLIEEYRAGHRGQRPDVATLRRIAVERSRRFTDSRGRHWLIPTFVTQAEPRAA